MKNHQDKLIKMIQSTKYSADEVKTYYGKHSSKISIPTVTTLFSNTESAKYIGKLCAAGLCDDEQLKIDYALYGLFQFAENSFDKDELVQLLNVCKANPNRFFNGKTALYMAVENCFPTEAIEILLDYNANPATGKLKIFGDHFYSDSTFNEAATMADYNDNYETVLLLMKKGYDFPAVLCSTTNSALFTEDSCFVGKLNSIYQTPSNFLKLSDDALMKYTHKQKSYLKSSALYGLKRDAKQLQTTGKLTEKYLEKSTELIKQINQKLENVAKKQNSILEQEKAKQAELEKQTAQQEVLFNKLNSVIKEETGEKCTVKKQGSKTVEEAVHAFKQNSNEGKEYSWIDKQ